MVPTETPYAAVTIARDSVRIEAHAGQLYNWSHRPGYAAMPPKWLDELDPELREYAEMFAVGDGGEGYEALAWPCSYLARLQTIYAEFDANGLVDLCSSSDDSLAERELPGDELSAWSSDVLRDVLPREHPCWDVCVGQFEDGER